MANTRTIPVRNNPKKGTGWRNWLCAGLIVVGYGLHLFTMTVVAGSLMIIGMLINPHGEVGVICDTAELFTETLHFNGFFTDLKQYKSEDPVVLDEARKYTMMVYMVGSNLESSQGAATADLEEMLKAKITDDVRVIVFTGGTYLWQNNLVSARNNQIWEIDSEGIHLVENWDKDNMGDPSVLRDFVAYSMKHFPADHYGLVLWDHGGGPVYGYGQPEDTDAEDIYLSLTEIAWSLENAFEGSKLDILGFDACAMGCVETVAMLAPYAQCIVASPELTIGDGWQYTNLLENMCDDVDLPYLSMGQIFAQSYERSMIESQLSEDEYDDYMYADQRDWELVTAVYDCSQIEPVVEALDALALNIYNDYHLDKVISRGGESHIYAEDSYDVIDSGMWALLYTEEYEEAREYLDALHNLVFYVNASNDIGYTSGISQYLPMKRENSEAYSEDIDAYLSMEFGNGNYRDLVAALYDRTLEKKDLFEKLMGDLLEVEIEDADDTEEE